jgi:GTPase
MGVSRMTREHLGITLALKIPFFIVITKIDMTPENVHKEHLDLLVKLIKSQNVNRMPVLIKDNREELEKCAENLAGDRVCPIFQVSSVTGEGIDKLIHFISILDARKKPNLKTKNDPFEYDINENFMVPGVGECL